VQLTTKDSLHSSMFFQHMKPEVEGYCDLTSCSTLFHALQGFILQLLHISCLCSFKGLVAPPSKPLLANLVQAIVVILALPIRCSSLLQDILQLPEEVEYKVG